MAVERHCEYETIYILRPGAGEENTQGARDRVEGIIDNTGGHLLKFDNWGPRKLAYPIRDKTEGAVYERGTYQYYRYLAAGGAVAEIERNLRILDPVVKFMTIKVDDDLIASERVKLPTEAVDIERMELEEEE